MFGRKKQSSSTGTGTVDGGEGRGVPLGGRDERPPTGYRRSVELDEVLDKDFENSDDRPELLWEDGDPADRRRDPLRKP